MINVLVSACLMGENCKYNGGNNYVKDIELIKTKANLVSVCPEVDGGLSVPRSPSEIRGERVVAKSGEDVTEYFVKGAELALETAKKHSCKIALLKAKSPSCGTGMVYDGSFEGVLCEGDGVTALLLKKNGIKVLNETQIDELLHYIEQNREV